VLATAKIVAEVDVLVYTLQCCVAASQAQLSIRISTHLTIDAHHISQFATAITVHTCKLQELELKLTPFFQAFSFL
jgi:hypothetical protein